MRVGLVWSSNALYIGYNPGSNGTYNLSGSGLLTANTEYTGYSGLGTVNQTGGTNGTILLNIGQQATGVGIYNLSAGSLAAQTEYIGNLPNGTLNQSGGTNTVSGQIFIGSVSAAPGAYYLSGSGLLNCYDEEIGYFGPETIVQSGGTIIVTTLYLGHYSYSGGSGSYSLSHAGQLCGSSEYVGFSSSGTFNQTGGTNTVSTLLQIGGTGTYNLQGGVLIVPSIASSGLLNLDGGTLMASGSFSVAAPISLAGDIGPAFINPAGNAVTLSGPLSGSGGLIELGTGSLTLAGSNTYLGGTDVSGGFLIVDGAAAMPWGGSLIIGGPTANLLGFGTPVPSPVPSSSSGNNAVSPVPEPNTSVMLFVGFVALGVSLIRRCKRQG